MAYEVYLGNVLCPIAPSKIDTKIKNQNKTMNLINDGEINILKTAGLTEISFDLLLPNVKYPFATYKSGFVNAKVFLDEFEKMKAEQKTFQFKVIRKFPNGNMLFDTDMKVSMEDYTIKEDAKQGFDIVVSVKLKQFKDYGTKVCKIVSTDDETKTVSPQTVRETENSPAPTGDTIKTHTVVKGDCLWNIAKKYYGDGSKYTAIVDANSDKITNPNSISVGLVLVIPNASATSASTSSSSPSSSPSKKSNTTKTKSSSGSCTITATIPRGFENFFKVGIAYNDANGNYKFTGYSTSAKATTSIGRKVTLKLEAIWYDGTTAVLSVWDTTSKARFNHWVVNGKPVRGSEGKRDYTFTCDASTHNYTANCSKI